MAKTLILGNNPDIWWRKDISYAEFISVPNISNSRVDMVSSFVLSLPKDADCIVIDADSMDPSNIQLPLDLLLYIRLMLHDCCKSSLSQIIIVSEFEMESYRGYGPKSMVLMTQNVMIVRSENVIDAIKNSKPMTPSDYVSGFLNLIKIEPQEKVEGRHSIANEWGAEALFNVVSGGIKSNIISIKATSSLYFKYSNVVSLDAEDVKLIINGKNLQYLTQKVIIRDKIRYLIIDDEASKGWDRVLNYLLPNATQDVWSQPVNSYDEISQEIRNKISSGYYDLIFLDLRMAGISEDNVIKPHDFSGMKILKSIKRENRGIQTIMLTATNKAWNVKALLDAGANGYYMKESPEYHFSLKYSEENALALVSTIKECLNNAYQQDIVSQVRELVLPSDSELSMVIYNQLSIAISLLLKARSKADYAFAYISLEQVFEIASSHLISQQQEGKNISYYFTEDTKERCRSYVNGQENGWLISSKGGAQVAQWMKIASIYYQLYDGRDDKFDQKAKRLISLRNQYIHPNNGVKPDITSGDFIDLFRTVKDFLSVFK